jgi:transposase
MSSRSFNSKKDGLAKCVTTQLDLFDDSVCDHTVAASSLCTHHAPKSRCMMRQTYSQVWPAYNQAQVNEKSRLLELLYELCNGIEEPVQTFGRPRLPFAEMLFCAAYKVYSGFSSRRFISDLQIAKERGYVSKVPHFNSVSNYMEMESLTPYLRALIIESSKPLAAIEFDFAVDSSGFATGRNTHWVDTKWNKEARKYGETTRTINKKDWLKAHLMCGVRTNVVTSVEISHAFAADTSYFPTLVEQTSQNFVMNEVSADKAYSSQKNLQLVLVKGAQPYIPFKSNTNPSDHRSGSLWKRMFHFYKYNEEWFKRHYHKRSNVETVFSMIKGKFGERLKSKSQTAQMNEVLCKVLCHNVCCLIQSIYELGIEPTFWSDATIS